VRAGRSIRTLGPFLAGLALATAIAAEERPIHREKLEYDPASAAWVQEPPPVPGTPEGDLRLARGAFADGDLRGANRRLIDWIQAYGDAHELYPQVAILRAEVEISRRDYYKAHKHLQQFLNEYAGTEHAVRAAELEFVIAEVFLSGTRRKFLGLRILKADDIAISILDDLTTNYPEANLGERAVKTKADYYFRQGEFSLAEMEYAQIVKDFPRSRYVRYSMRRSADAALASFNGIQFDDAPLIEAEERYRDYLVSYPGSGEQEGIGLVLQDIRSQRAAKEFEIGRYYERTGHNRAAAFYYRSTIDSWTDTIAASRAQERLDRLAPEDSARPGRVPPVEEPPPPTMREEMLREERNP